MLMAPLAHNTNIAAGLMIFAGLVIILVALPVMVGMAIGVARQPRDGRWRPLLIGGIVSVFIAALVAIEFKLAITAIGGIGLGGGALLGALIGGLVRLIRRGRG